MFNIERLVHRTDNLTPLGQKRAINRAFRDADESHLYPINNQFDATERAIRRVAKFQREYGAMYGLEYALAIDAELDSIINSIY